MRYIVRTQVSSTRYRVALVETKNIFRSVFILEILFD
jgi:hypothetical protein